MQRIRKLLLKALPMRSKVIPLCIALFSCSSVSAQTAEQILKGYFSAIGGIEKIRQFTTSSSRSLNIQHYPKKDTSLITNVARVPEFSHTQSFRKQELLFESYANDKGMTQLFYKPFPNKIEFPKARIQLSFAHDILLAYDKRKVKRSADTLINDRAAFALKSTLAKKDFALNRTYYFDKESFHLIALRSENLKGSFTFLENYSIKDGIAMPMKTTHVLNGHLLNEFIVQAIEINPALHDSLFVVKEHVPTSPKFRLNKQIEFLDESLANMDFQQFAKQFHGKTILIDLWASWCGPCKFEFSKYDDAYFHYLKLKNIEPVFISVDKPEKEKEWKKSIDQFILNGKHVRAGKKLYQSIQKQFYASGTVYIPRLILIGPDGQVLSAELPRLTSGMFYSKVDELVNTITP